MVNRCVIFAAVEAALLIVVPRAGLTLSRFNATMDNGTSIVVDNDSSWTNSQIASLVLAADRSTQEDCPYSLARKGLLRTGDRIYASNYYLAWFDYTTSDGIAFANPPYSAPGGRSGDLAGWWSLNPASPNFRYFRTGPNGCSNWAHNELIPGSASPNHEQHWWDKYYTPSEHVICPIVGANKFFFPYTDAWRTGNSQFTVVTDGVKDATGVHYKTSCRMSSWHGNIDVTDDNDANGIANYIQATIDYACQPTGLTCTWQFKPNNADIISYNTFVFLWTSYAQDEDDTTCDAGGAGSQWPGTVYGRMLYNQSSLTLRTNFSSTGPFAPSSIVQMLLGPTCSSPYQNQDMYTDPSFSVGDGTWLRVGESPTLSINSPRFQYTNLGIPGSGSGAQSDPVRFAWDTLESFNETHDGTLGFGGKRGPYQDPVDYFTLQSGKWYQSQFTLSVATQATATIGLDQTALVRSVVRGNSLPRDTITVTNIGQGQLNYALSGSAGWLSFAPTTGTSTGESDPIAIDYYVSALDFGDYTTTISIADPDASNSPQTVTITVHVLHLGDFDDDGDVDQADFAHLQNCFTQQFVSSTCKDADLNGDHVVGDFDVNLFIGCMGGANLPPGC